MENNCVKLSVKLGRLLKLKLKFVTFIKEMLLNN